jgi:hypothetical protein
MDKIKNSLTKNKNPLNYTKRTPNLTKKIPKITKRDPKMTIRPLLDLFVMFGVFFAFFEGGFVFTVILRPVSQG